MNYKTEYATPADLENLSQLFTEILLDIPYYNALAKENEKERYCSKELSAKLQEDPYSIIIIKDDHQIVAFCFSRFDDFTIWLEWFGIVPLYRGKGLSKLLLEKLEESTVARKCHKIWCDTRTENERSINVLTKYGFEKITEIKNHWYGQDFFLWQKSIMNEHPHQIHKSDI